MDKFERIEDIDKETAKFIATVASAYVSIIKLLQDYIDSDLSIQKRNKLERQLASIFSNLDKKTISYIKNTFYEYYKLSLRKIDLTAIDLGGVGKISGSQHAIHKKALERAVSSLYEDIAKNTTFMSKEIKKIIRSNTQELLTAMIEGGEAYPTIKKKLKEQLLKDGITSFVDAGKKHWKIDRYVDTVVRTKSRILHNEGTINRLKEYQEQYSQFGEYVEDFDLIQISNHGSEDWCGIFEDKVFSISGKSERYPSIETLPNRPYEVLHPNCKHVWLAYIPSLNGRGQTVSANYQNVSLSKLNKIDYEAKKKQK